MREIRLSGSEGGVASPPPFAHAQSKGSRLAASFLHISWAVGKMPTLLEGTLASKLAWPRSGEPAHSRRGGVPPPWPMRGARAVVWRPFLAHLVGKCGQMWARCPLSLKGTRCPLSLKGARCPHSLKGTLASKLAWPRRGEPAPSRRGGVPPNATKISRGWIHPVVNFRTQCSTSSSAMCEQVGFPK